MQVFAGMTVPVQGADGRLANVEEAKKAHGSASA